MRRLALALAVVLVALAVALVAASTAALAAPGGSKVSYRPPVRGEIVDPFRPPPEQWLAGNRGIDYRPGPGTPVKASADGEVVFAGQVGGELHVVLLHADGIRTSYSFLQSLAVQRGARVRQGDVVGLSHDGLHFGARVGDEYIDPRTLFDDELPRVYLVPDEARRPASEAEERSGLARFLGAASGLVQGYWDDIVAHYRTFQHYKSQLKWSTHLKHLVGTAVEWWKQRGACTPDEVRPPPMPERRIAVLVAGLGSSSSTDPAGRPAIDDLMPLDLGYASSIRFSYNGGSIADNPYDAQDTTGDLTVQARRLRDLLEQVHRNNPGVPVDVIAHSQGGVIARWALAYLYDPEDPRLPVVRNLVTLGSPHQGTDLATAGTAFNHTLTGRALLETVNATGLAPFDLNGTSIEQMSETSDYIRDLNARALPSGINLTSIGARGDLIVPGIHTTAGEGRNVIVSLPGVWQDHDQLPGSAQAQREVALAIAGLPPTCQTLGNMLADTAVSDAIATGEDLAAALALAKLKMGGGVVP